MMLGYSRGMGFATNSEIKDPQVGSLYISHHPNLEALSILVDHVYIRDPNKTEIIPQ